MKMYDKFAHEIQVGDVLLSDYPDEKSIDAVVEFNGKLCGVKRIEVPHCNVLEGVEPKPLRKYNGLVRLSRFAIFPSIIPSVEIIGNVTDNPNILTPEFTNLRFVIFPSLMATIKAEQQQFNGSSSFGLSLNDNSTLDLTAQCHRNADEGVGFKHVIERVLTHAEQFGSIEETESGDPDITLYRFTVTRQNHAITPSEHSKVIVAQMLYSHGKSDNMVSLLP